MVDPRIVAYHSAALQMKKGSFQGDLQIAPTEDEIGELGIALLELGETLETKFAEVNKLYHITEQINAGLLLDEVLDHVYNSFRPVIPYDRIGFSLLEDENKVVRARWARSEASEIKLKGGYSAPLEGSSLQRIIETGHPRILNDLESYLRDHPSSESTQLIVAEGMRSSLTCPLISLNKPIGFMFFSSAQPNTYRDVHREIFLQIAGQLSMVVEKSRLYEQLLEAERIRVLAQTAGAASHEINQPLSAVLSLSQLLMRDSSLHEEQKRKFELIYEAAQRISAIVRKMGKVQEYVTKPYSGSTDIIDFDTAAQK